MATQRKRKPTKTEQSGMLIVAGLAVCAVLGVCGGILSAFDDDEPGPDAPATPPADVTTSYSAGPSLDVPGEAARRMATVEPTEDQVEAEPDPGEDGPEDVYYPNCAAVRAAGAAPIRRGDPGYSRKLDRDGDGTACE